MEIMNWMNPKDEFKGQHFFLKANQILLELPLAFAEQKH